MGDHKPTSAIVKDLNRSARLVQHHLGKIRSNVWQEGFYITGGDPAHHPLDRLGQMVPPIAFRVPARVVGACDSAAFEVCADGMQAAIEFIERSFDGNVSVFPTGLDGEHAPCRARGLRERDARNEQKKTQHSDVDSKPPAISEAATPGPHKSLRKPQGKNPSNAFWTRIFREPIAVALWCPEPSIRLL